MDNRILYQAYLNPLGVVAACLPVGILITQFLFLEFPYLTVFLYTLMIGILFSISALVDDLILQLFLVLFTIRYYRLIIGIVAYFAHKSVPVSNNLAGALFPGDITAVLPTVNPQSQKLVNTIRSVCAAGVARIIVILPRREQDNTEWLIGHEDLIKYQALNKIVITFCDIANKRHQVCTGLLGVHTEFVALVDDHVTWPNNFLENVMAPFQDASIGGIAMWKRVVRNNLPCDIFRNFWSNITDTEKGLVSAIKTLFDNFDIDICNFLGCLYLERHNFDITASHAIDGGLFVISGRTALYRSDIICQADFMQAFCNETWLWGMVGPLNADDDNFITRWLVTRGIKIAWQHGPQATILTTIGESGFKIFNAQCLRWARTTWRSNSTSLFGEGLVWFSQPWSIYAVYLTSFINFAAFMDGVIVYLCYRTGFTHWYMIMVWIFLSKIVKTLPHFSRHPHDLIYLPLYILFGYYHSMLKLYALLTCWETTWGSRPNAVR